MNNITFSKGCTDLIGLFEGTKLSAYPDPVTHGEPYTIGKGSTHYCNDDKVKLGDPDITLEVADSMVLCHLNSIVLPDLQKHIKVDLTQNQIDALGCLIFNIGNNAFDSSHVLIDVNEGILSGDLKTRWLAWDHSGDKIINGLLIRRQKEYNYFETGSINTAC